MRGPVKGGEESEGDGAGRWQTGARGLSHQGVQGP